MRLVWKGFIVLYQDTHNNLKQYPTYQCNSDKRKALIQFNIFYKYLAYPLPLLWGVFLSSDSIWLSISFFNQNIMNGFGIYKFWQSNTHIIMNLIFTERKNFCFSAFIFIFIFFFLCQQPFYPAIFNPCCLYQTQSQVSVGPFGRTYF